MVASINLAGAITIMTVEDVAVYLRFSSAKVYRMAREGRLPAVRIGREWRFRRDLLDAWLEHSSEANVKMEKPLIEVSA